MKKIMAAISILTISSLMLVGCTAENDVIPDTGTTTEVTTEAMDTSMTDTSMTDTSMADTTT